jgi:hypothetical protein
LKYWYLDDETGDVIKSGKEPNFMMRSETADLTKVNLKLFVGVSIAKGFVYSLTQDGHIYMYDKQRKLQKWMNIKVTRAMSCYINRGRLFCACCDGVMRVFDTTSLKHLLTMSKPPPLGTTNLLAGVSRIRIPSDTNSVFGDILVSLVDEKN